MPTAPSPARRTGSQRETGMAPHSTAFSAREAIDREPRDIEAAASSNPITATDLAVIDTLDGVRALADDWRRLEDEGAAGFNFFQSFAWNMRWTERFIPAAESQTVAILTGRQKGRLVMLWPMMIEQHGPVRMLKWLGDPFPQYGGALIARDVDRAFWFDRAWRHMTALAGIDAIALRRVRADDPANDCLTQGSTRKVGRGVTCFIEIGGFESHHELMDALPSRRRQLRRKLRRKLEAEGGLEYRTAFGGPEFESIIRETMRLKRRWLRDAGQLSKAVSDPRLDELLLSFAGEGLDTGRVGAGVLTCGGQPAAYEIAFHYRHHHYLYIIAQDPRFVSQSPSKVQVDEAQAWDIANGVEVFDLLPPADRYKLDLSDQTVAIFDYLKPLSFIGMLYVAYLVRARPALKALYLKYVAPIAGGLFGRRHR